MTFKGLHIYTGDRLQWMARQQASRPLQSDKISNRKILIRLEAARLGVEMFIHIHTTLKFDRRYGKIIAKMPTKFQWIEILDTNLTLPRFYEILR